MCIYIYNIYIYIYVYVYVYLYIYKLKLKLVHDTQSAQQAQSIERNTYIVKS